MLTIWDDTILEKIEAVEGNYSLTIRFRQRDTEQEWIHTNVYGPVRHE